MTLGSLPTAASPHTALGSGSLRAEAVKDGSVCQLGTGLEPGYAPGVIRAALHEGQPEVAGGKPAADPAVLAGGKMPGPRSVNRQPDMALASGREIGSQ